MYVCVCMCVYVCVCMYVSVCMCVYIRVCMCVCMHVYVCIPCLVSHFYVSFEPARQSLTPKIACLTPARSVTRQYTRVYVYVCVCECISVCCFTFLRLFWAQTAECAPIKRRRVRQDSSTQVCVCICVCVCVSVGISSHISHFLLSSGGGAWRQKSHVWRRRVW